MRKVNLMNQDNSIPIMPAWDQEDTSRIPFWAYTSDDIHKQELEKTFGDSLIFERLESKTASRVKFEMPYKELYKKRVRFTDKSGWPARIDWFSDTMPRFCKAVIPFWERVNL